MDMTAVATGTSQNHPPTPSHTGRRSSATGCRTTLVRPTVRPFLVPGPVDGVAPDDEYVRRYWVAAIGASAVADLLRLVAAAKHRREVRRPIHLPVLLSEGLAISAGRSVLVSDPIPRLGVRARRRIPGALRLELAATPAAGTILTLQVP